MPQTAFATFAPQFPLKPVPAGSITFTMQVCYVDTTTQRTEIVDNVSAAVPISGITLVAIGQAITAAIIAKGSTLGMNIVSSNVKIPQYTNGVP